MNRRSFLLSLSMLPSYAMAKRYEWKPIDDHSDDNQFLNREYFNRQTDPFDFFRKGQKTQSDVTFNIINIENVACFIAMPNFNKQGPVLIFSHDYLKTPEDYGSFLINLASKGIFIVVPIYRKNIDNIYSINDIPITKQLTSNELREDRIVKTNKIIEQMQSICEHFKFNSNLGRIFIMGEGFGAWTAQMMCGMWTGYADSKQVFYSPSKNIYGGIFVNPMSTKVTGIMNASWDAMNVPFLSIVSSKGKNYFGETYKDSEKSFYYSPSKYKYLAFIKKYSANIITGSDIPANSPYYNVYKNYIAVVAMFIQTYYTHNQKWLHLLNTPGYIDHKTNGELFEKHLAEHY